MAKIPKGKEFEKVGEGNHPAVCVGVVDLGTHEKEFKGKKYDSHQLRLIFQAVDQRTTEGEAMTISKDYTFSDASKNLKKDVKAWIGQDLSSVDPATLLLRQGNITVVHNESEKTGKTYANIEAITGLVKGQKVTKHTETPVSFFFDFEEDDDGNAIEESATFNQEDFDALPNHIQKIIVQSNEYPIALANNENGGWEGAKKSAKKKAAPAKGAKKK